MLSSAGKVKPGGKFFKMEVEGRSSVITDKVTHAIMRGAEIVKDAKKMDLSKIEEAKIGSETKVAKGVNTLRGLGQEEEKEGGANLLGGALAKLEAEAAEGDNGNALF